MRQFRTKTKITKMLAFKINDLLLLLNNRGEVSYTEVIKELHLSYNELNSLLCSATYVLPIYESENKKIGLLK